MYSKVTRKIFLTLLELTHNSNWRAPPLGLALSCCRQFFSPLSLKGNKKNEEEREGGQGHPTQFQNLDRVSLPSRKRKKKELEESWGRGGKLFRERKEKKGREMELASKEGEKSPPSLLPFLLLSCRFNSECLGVVTKKRAPNSQKRERKEEGKRLGCSSQEFKWIPGVAGSDS